MRTWKENAIASRFVYAVLLLFVCAAAGAAELYGKVVGIADGDTLTVLDELRHQHRVRLAGIDAPEKRQAYGARAKQHLAGLVQAKAVFVVWTKRDRYGRIVGRVLAAQCDLPGCRYALDVGLEQIRAGLAWHYKQYEREQPPEERARYASMEMQARERSVGLWQKRDPVPPWEFRHSSGRAEGIAEPRASWLAARTGMAPAGVSGAER